MQPKALLAWVHSRLLLGFACVGWLARQVEELLPKGVDSIPQLSVALVTISKALDSEMAAMPAHEVRGVAARARCGAGQGGCMLQCSGFQGLGGMFCWACMFVSCSAAGFESFERQPAAHRQCGQCRTCGCGCSTHL